MPGTDAAAEELLAIADGMAAAGHGVFQFAPDHARVPVEEWPWMEELARRTGRTVSVNLNQPDQDPGGVARGAPSPRRRRRGGPADGRADRRSLDRDPLLPPRQRAPAPVPPRLRRGGRPPDGRSAWSPCETPSAAGGSSRTCPTTAGSSPAWCSPSSTACGRWTARTSTTSPMRPPRSRRSPPSRGIPPMQLVLDQLTVGRRQRDALRPVLQLRLRRPLDDLRGHPRSPHPPRPLGCRRPLRRHLRRRHAHLHAHPLGARPAAGPHPPARVRRAPPDPADRRAVRAAAIEGSSRRGSGPTST